MRYVLIAVLALPILTRCADDRNAAEKDATPPAVDYREFLPGTWEKIGLTVDINSFNNQDSAFTVQVREEDWAETTQSLPTLTYFLLDNKYRQEFRALNGDTLFVSRGMWNIFGDTLHLVEPDTSYQFLLSINESRNLEMRRQIDWDGDGLDDDDYLEIHRRISRSAQ